MAGIVRGGFALLLLTAALSLAGCTADLQAVVPASAAVEKPSPAARYKEARALLHAAEKAQLNDIAHGSPDAELAQMAQAQLLEVCRRDEQELTCEGVLELRGFVDPVVTVHAGTVNVLLGAESLTEQACAVILELVCRETDAAAENVKIIPVK